MAKRKRSFFGTAIELLKRNEIIAALLVLNLVLVSGNLFLTKAISLDAKTTGNAQAQPQPQAQPQQQQPAQQPLVKVSLDDDPVEGNVNAPVTIVEFSDFQCPYCGRFFQQTLPQIRQNYIDTGKVKIVYRDFPLSFHQYAQKAAEAAECADDQGKFWEYHNTLFNKQSEWTSKGVDALKGYAADLGLNTGKFNTCLDSGAKTSEVKKDISDGASYGVSGTPAFFINGQKLVGAQPYQVFQAAIEQALAG